MKLIAPDYFSEFRCIAGACRHSCCIGWEIDIDPDTLERYRHVPGDMGSRLRSCIEEDGEGAHFRLGADERCPFLNQDGLCELILALGENSLCQICADHPRFRNYFSDRTEIGLGLCCEAACALILGCREPVQLTVLEDDGGGETLCEDESELTALRDELIAIAQDRSMPICDRVRQILAECEVALPERSPKQWAAVYAGLEQLDPAWSGKLSSLAALEDAALPLPDAFEVPLEQLLAYFLYRHLPAALEDGDVTSRVAFALHAWQMVRMLCLAHLAAKGRLAAADLFEIARMYSAEIEYSDENISTLLNMLCE